MVADIVLLFSFPTINIDSIYRVMIWVFDCNLNSLRSIREIELLRLFNTSLWGQDENI